MCLCVCVRYDRVYVVHPDRPKVYTYGTDKGSQQRDALSVIQIKEGKEVFSKNHPPHQLRKGASHFGTRYSYHNTVKAM